MAASSASYEERKREFVIVALEDAGHTRLGAEEIVTLVHDKTLEFERLAWREMWAEMREAT